DDTWRYRAAKFVRRHRLGVAAAAFAFLSLFGGLLGALTQARIAAREAERATATRDFIVKGLIQLTDPDAPGEVLDQTFTQRELITALIERLGTLVDPLDRASVMDAIAFISIEYTWFEQAETLLLDAYRAKVEALGPAHPDLSETLLGLGLVAQNTGRPVRADSLYRRGLDVLGGSDADPSPLRLDLQLNLAFINDDRGRYEEALAWGRRAVAMSEALLDDRPEDPDVQLAWALARRILATVQYHRGDLEQAQRWFLEALRRLDVTFARPRSETANTLMMLARVQRNLGELRSAEQSILRAVSIYEAVYPPDHFTHGRGYYALAQLYHRNLDEPAQAARYYRRALAVERATGRPRDPLFTLIAYGQLLLSTGAAAEAESVLGEALGLYAALAAQPPGLAPGDSLYEAYTRLWLGQSLLEQQRLDDAEQALRRSYAFYRTRPGHAHAGLVLTTLGQLYRAQEQPDSAAVFERRYERWEAMQGE
ncbi:MAG: tetratricopeptide repeat protein, partial [Rhodothermales bacterium]|nr:tetratricopeptide repeat protein [Rhodothermales bacterium]